MTKHDWKRRRLMKKFMVIMLFVTFVAGSFGMAMGNGFGPGPAPNSGDGIPDGSGFDDVGQNGTGSSGSGNGPSGPAPNSGDGIPDGSGFDGSCGPYGP
jgi:hypothetical protein